MRNKPASFLIINTYGIGDVLFSTPLIRNLKTAFPEARIFYLCNRRTAVILKDHPLVEKTFVYERDEFKAVQARSLIAWAALWSTFIRAIRREKIDIVFDLSMNSLFGFISCVAGIRQRIGFDYKGRGLFLTKKLPLAGFEGKHVIEHHLDLLRSMKVPVTTFDMEVFSSPEKRA